MILSAKKAVKGELFEKEKKTQKTNQIDEKLWQLIQKINEVS